MLHEICEAPPRVYNTFDFHSTSVRRGDTQHCVYKEEAIERGSMVSWLDSETRKTWIRVSALPFLFKRPWTDYFSSLNYRFLSCEMDIIRESSLQG